MAEKKTRVRLGVLGSLVTSLVCGFLLLQLLPPTCPTCTVTKVIGAGLIGLAVGKRLARKPQNRQSLNHCRKRRKGVQLEHAAAAAVALAVVLILEIWKKPFPNNLLGGLVCLAAAVVAFFAVRWRQNSVWR